MEAEKHEDDGRDEYTGLIMEENWIIIGMAEARL